MAVFVLDRSKHPLMPCSEKRARLLLERGRARVHRLVPFTIRLVDRSVETSVLQPLRLKLDPGSKVTGLAIVREAGDTHHVLHLAEVHHRGAHIRKVLQQRAGYRRGRRSRNLRYRAPRFLNRRRPDGWLAPSLQHRMVTAETWVKRYRSLAPIVALTVERVRFDLQQMVTPEISGVEYQQGTLAGYEVREYLLEKWGRTCVYCDWTDRPLQVEHLIPKGSGGSDRVSNLALACESCNAAKGNQTVEAYLAHDPVRRDRILQQAQQPLRDAAAVNATRWAIWEMLTKTGLDVEATTGGRTKWNRSRLGIPKRDAWDAACAGTIEQVVGWDRPIQRIDCLGRGSHQRTRVTKDGFPRGYLPRTKMVRGFRTGDHVRATVPTGKKTGTWIGRVAVRTTGSFDIQTVAKTVQGISARWCVLLQRGDGYRYSRVESEPPLAVRPSSRRPKATLSGPRVSLVTTRSLEGSGR